MIRHKTHPQMYTCTIFINNMPWSIWHSPFACGMSFSTSLTLTNRTNLKVIPRCQPNSSVLTEHHLGKFHLFWTWLCSVEGARERKQGILWGLFEGKEQWGQDVGGRNKRNDSEDDIGFRFLQRNQMTKYQTSCKNISMYVLKRIFPSRWWVGSLLFYLCGLYIGAKNTREMEGVFLSVVHPHTS